jgi:hypothetical protein
MAQYTALFTMVYVFIVMEVSTRRIAHVNVTTNPTLDWEEPAARYRRVRSQAAVLAA